MTPFTCPHCGHPRPAPGPTETWRCRLCKSEFGPGHGGSRWRFRRSTSALGYAFDSALYLGLIGVVLGAVVGVFIPAWADATIEAGAPGSTRGNANMSPIAVFGLIGVLLGGAFSQYWREDKQVRLVARFLLVFTVVALLFTTACVQSLRIDEVRNSRTFQP